jgi:ATP-binding cassette subfamily C protein CydCD
MVAHATAARVQASLRQALYDRIVALGPAYLGRTRSGEVLMALIDGVETLESYFGQYLPQFVIAAATPILIFAFVAFLDLPVALVLLAGALATLFLPWVWLVVDWKRNAERNRDYGAFASEFLDSVQGLATLKAFGQTASQLKLLRHRADDLYRSTMRVMSTSTVSRAVTDCGITIGAALALTVGAYRVIHGDMTLATLLVVLMLGTEVFRPLRDLRILLHTGLQGRSAATGIVTLLAMRPEVEAPAAASAPAPAAIKPSVAFDRVRFAYAGERRPAHDGVSFAVAPGERVGIVGASGAGKSTIVSLLLRFYDPQEGSVRLGGIDLRHLSFGDLRRMIAVVTQDAFLFHGTVEDNLRVGKPDATPAELEAAARTANAHEFIARLPQGYRTVIGERGVRLSGGQRQRIAIARALLRDAPILVLDEALSAVDAENEWVIQDALDRLMAGRTTLIFAHRLSSVIDADRILVLDDGRVVESGSHAELLARGGAYERLMAPQLKDDTLIAAPAAARLVQDRGAEASAEQTTFDRPTDAIIRAEGMTWARVIVELFKHIAPWRGMLAGTFALGIGRIGALVGVGVLSALIVRAVKASDPFLDLVAVLAAAAAAAGVLHWLESWLAHDMAYRLLAEMRLKMFKKLDDLAPAYFARRRTGDLVGVATHDVEMIEFFFAHTVAPAFVAVVVPAAVLGTLATYGWSMAAALAPFLAAAWAQPFLARRRLDALGARSREAFGDLNAHALDTVQGMATVVAFAAARRRGVELAEKTARAASLRLPFFADLARQAVFQELIAGLGGLAVVIAGAALVAQQALDSAMLPLLALLAMAAFLPISEIAEVGRQLADTLGSTRRIYAVHDEEVPVRSGPGAAAPAAAAPAVVFERVTFTYPGRVKPALRDVSFAAAAGATVALVGPSGAGKTTVANLMLRFWDPQAGAVRLFGHDLRAYDLDHLRRQVSLVAQDTFLFNDTLRRNVLLARPEASAAELAAAVAGASLGDFVATLPRGLDTLVGERGAQLSGGQRQRVAIARAFLKGAPVLILDEATSHLDAVNEAAVREALDRLMTGRTTLVIAHRLSTVRSADQILVFDDGAIVEAGTHDRLLKNGGAYAHLVSRQLAGMQSAAAAQ